MKILLYGLNYSPELTGSGKYTGELGQWLARQGHDVRAVVAPAYYPDWQVHQGFHAWRYVVTREHGVRVIRCPLYVPKAPRLISRILHLASFALSSAAALFTQWRWRPDLVIMIAPTLCCAPGALLFARACGANTLLHVQDFEIDAMFGLGMAQKGLLHRLAVKFESSVLRRFDRVSTISPAMLLRAQHKGVPQSRLTFFPNWSDIQRFREAERSPNLLRRLGMDPEKRIVLYAGNLGDKQGLEAVIEVAERCVDQPAVQFLIVGDGVARKRLVQSAQDRQLGNITFAPLQSEADLPALLASGDCHLVVQRPGAADAVLPSKLTNILAVGGNAVITADQDTSLGALCAQHSGIAIRVDPESVDDLLAGIQQALQLPRHNEVAARYARDYLDKDQILHKFLRDIEASR